MNRINAAVTLCIGLMLAMPANAELVRAMWTGTVTDAVDGNAFGLATGDTVNGFAQIDTDVMFYSDEDNATFATHGGDPNSDFQLVLSIGSRNFLATDDFEYELGAGAVGFAGDITTVRGMVDMLTTAFLGPDLVSCSLPDPEVSCVSPDGLGLDTFNFYFDGEPDASVWHAYENGVLAASGTWDMNSVQMQVVPVPGALLLFASALTGAGLFRRRPGSV